MCRKMSRGSNTRFCFVWMRTLEIGRSYVMFVLFTAVQADLIKSNQTPQMRERICWSSIRFSASSKGMVNSNKILLSASSQIQITKVFPKSFQSHFRLARNKTNAYGRISSYLPCGRISLFTMWSLSSLYIIVEKWDHRSSAIYFKMQ